MPKITPNQFKDAFLEVVLKEPEIAAKWNGPQSTYTSLMRDKVLRSVGDVLKLKTYSSDYYTLDCIYYKEKDVENFPANYTYAKCISIALEHENEVNTSCIEMNKLQLFNTPLKVLITYARQNCHLELLNKYSDIVREADIFSDFATHRRQLVIFGDLQEGCPVWAFYAYGNDDFIKI